MTEPTPQAQELYQQQAMERNRKVTRSLRLFADGFSPQFAEFVYSDERFTELVMDLAAVYITENIPVIDEDAQYDLALMLMENISIVSRDWYVRQAH